MKNPADAEHQRGGGEKDVFRSSVDITPVRGPVSAKHGLVHDKFAANVAIFATDGRQRPVCRSETYQIPIKRRLLRKSQSVSPSVVGMRSCSR